MLPNAIWITIVGAAVTVINTYFGGEPWAYAVVAGLLAAGKAIEVNVVKPLPPAASSSSAQARGMGDAPVAQPSKIQRFLVG